jgi:hypothetical protein
MENDIMHIKILPIEFTKSGIYYKQVKRENDVAIYSLACTLDVSRKIGFDCIKVQSYAPDYESPFFANRRGQKWDIVETYPTSESFGTKAWSFDTIVKAEELFQNLTKRIETEYVNSSLAKGT